MPLNRKGKQCGFFDSTVMRFVLTGGLSTGIDFVIYMALSSLIPIPAAKTISMLCASVVSYVTNKVFTFKNRDRTNASYLIRYYAVFLANLATNTGVNALMFGLIHNKVFSFVIATGAGMVVNYLGQRFFVFSIKR